MTEIPSQTKEADTPKLKSPSIPWSYWLGLLVLGTVIGLFVGTSDSPVVGVTVPLLFAIATTAMGAHAIKGLRNRKARSDHLRLVGLTTIAFAIPVLIGSAYGIAIRKHLGFNAFLPPIASDNSTKNLDILKSKKGSELLRLLVLRPRLVAAGATSDQQEVIISGILDDEQRNVFKRLRDNLVSLELESNVLVARAEQIDDQANDDRNKRLDKLRRESPGASEEGIEEFRQKLYVSNRDLINQVMKPDIDIEKLVEALLKKYEFLNFIADSDKRYPQQLRDDAKTQVGKANQVFKDIASAYGSNDIWNAPATKASLDAAEDNFKFLLTGKGESSPSPLGGLLSLLFSGGVSK